MKSFERPGTGKTPFTATHNFDADHSHRNWHNHRVLHTRFHLPNSVHNPGHCNHSFPSAGTTDPARRCIPSSRWATAGVAVLEPAILGAGPQIHLQPLPTANLLRYQRRSLQIGLQRWWEALQGLGRIVGWAQLSNAAGCCCYCWSPAADPLGEWRRSRHLKTSLQRARRRRDSPCSTLKTRGKWRRG